MEIRDMLSEIRMDYPELKINKVIPFNQMIMVFMMLRLLYLEGFILKRLKNLRLYYHPHF